MWVGGEVRAPGSTGLRVRRICGMRFIWRVESRRTRRWKQRSCFERKPDGTLKIVSVNLNAALAGNPADNLILQPRDRLLIHRSAARVEPATVYIKGEVAKPGRYPLTSNMHLEDLIGVAGGLKRSADRSRQTSRAIQRRVKQDRMDARRPRASGGICRRR